MRYPLAVLDITVDRFARGFTTDRGVLSLVADEICCWPSSQTALREVLSRGSRLYFVVFAYVRSLSLGRWKGVFASVRPDVIETPEKSRVGEGALQAPIDLRRRSSGRDSPPCSLPVHPHTVHSRRTSSRALCRLDEAYP